MKPVIDNRVAEQPHDFITLHFCWILATEEFALQF
jgi:hypothetical protein